MSRLAAVCCLPGNTVDGNMYAIYMLLNISTHMYICTVNINIVKTYIYIQYKFIMQIQQDPQQ